MRFGVNLINFGPGCDPAAMRGWVDMTQDLGYHGLFTSDHVTITDDVAERYPAPFYEPHTMLGWLAGVTSQITIGTTVTVLPYRSPLETARAVANADQLSGGRCVLGVGAGWAAEEFKLLGVPFDQRGPITTEYLEAIKVLWRDEVASFHGDHVSFDRVHSAPLPAQRPHPPIWVGGNSAPSMRRAILHGTAWHPIRPTATGFRDDQLPAFRALAAHHERPVPDLCPRIRLRITDTPRPEDERIAGEGTLDQIRSDLEIFESVGCDWIVLDTFHDYLVEELNDNEQQWRQFAALAADVVDLATGGLR